MDLKEKINKYQTEITLLLFFLIYNVVAPLISNTVLNILNLEKYKLIATIITQIIIGCIVIFINKEHLKGKQNQTFILKGIKYGCLILLLNYLTAIVIMMFFENTQSSNSNKIAELLISFRIPTMLAVTVIAPIMEELVFRKHLYDFSNRILKNPKISSMIVIFIFSILHCKDYILAREFYELYHVLHYLPLAICLQKAYEDNYDIRVPIITHMFNNIVSTLFML